MEYKALAFLEEVAATIELSFDDTDGTLDVIMKNSDGEQVASGSVTVNAWKAPVISATATVDEGTGTPSVEVIKSGTADAPSFKFEFHNLKGADGQDTSGYYTLGYKYLVNAQEAPYDDLDTFPANEIVTFNAVPVENAPVGTISSGTLMTLSNYNDKVWLTSQILIIGTDNYDTAGRMFLRFRYTTTYNKWVEFASFEDVETAINQAIENIAGPNTVVASVDLYSPAIFERIGVIGDSFGTGLIIDTDTSDPVVQENNAYLRWGAIMCRLLGNTYVNYAVNGANFQSCIEDTLPTILGDTACNLYIINLGINGDNYDVGTINDVSTTDPNDNPATLYGNCGKIVLSIQQHAPKAKIILAYQVIGSNQTNLTMLQEIAQKLGCAFINPQTDDYFFKGGSSAPLRQFYTNHPTAPGYSGMALAFIRLISKCMSENVDYFKFYDLY